jgi:membrane protein
MEKSAWRGFADFCLAVFWRFYEERALQTAGSLTYTTLLSLVPLITVALAVATAFPVFDDAIDALQLFLLETCCPTRRASTPSPSSSAPSAATPGADRDRGLGFFFVTAVMLMTTIDTALNRLFRVQSRAAMLQQVLMYWAVITARAAADRRQPVR